MTDHAYDFPPFVDSHVHFYEAGLETHQYPWLDKEVEHDVFGNMGAIQAQRYWPDDFLAETRFCNLTKSIHVNAAATDSIEETRWLQGFADRLGHPHGIVAGISFGQPGFMTALEEHLEHRNMRGVRDLKGGSQEEFNGPAWISGVAELGPEKLVLCVNAKHQEFDQLGSLAARVPSVTICLDHAGFPRQRDENYYQAWRASVVDLARHPNIVVKISGLGMGDRNWTLDSMRPFVESCIEIFGIDRAFFGTNWPFDRLFSSYPDVVRAYARLTQGYSMDEQRALFSANAERIFNL